jgi:predicted RNase H-like HicB family nuclease
MVKRNFDRQIEHLMSLPWTIVRETTPEGNDILKIAELPSVVVSGDTDEEMTAELAESLRESLRAYLHFGDPIPVPCSAARRSYRVGFLPPA